MSNKVFGILPVAFILMLSACSMIGDEDDIGTIGYIDGFIGGVSADEPRATLVGRDILSAGGNAVDAAVAMYFTLSVTLPSSASLGGGGICMVHDPETLETRALNFLARLPANISTGASRPSAIPGNPRGFYALHAKYGKLRWEELVAPAANLARFGTPVSRALARNLSAANDALIEDMAFAEIFSSSEPGKLLGEGVVLTQLNLSMILSQLSSNGPGDFYNGKTAAVLVDAVERAGGTLSLNDLRDYRPRWEDTLQVPIGDHTMHFPLPPAAAGAVEAVMLDLLTDDGRYMSANGELEKAHLMAEVAMLAYADRARWMLDSGETRWSPTELAEMSRVRGDMENFSQNTHKPASGLSTQPVKYPENPSGTSFVVADRKGGAVACSLSMNNMFGTGRIAPGTGIVLATIADQKGRGPVSLGPSIMSNKFSGKLFWAGAASGGVAASTSLMNVMARTVLEQRPMRSAMAAKRIHHGGFPDTTYYEKGLDQWIVDGLVSRGHNVSEISSIGRVNAISCYNSLQEAPESCSIAVDPRGFGHALMSE